MVRLTWIAVVAVLGCEGSVEPRATDAAFDASGRDGGADAMVPAMCEGDRDCADDGLFCNGVPRCAPGAMGADEHGCVGSEENPCLPDQRCNELTRHCDTECDEDPDADGDSHDAVTCGGGDCDDGDVNRYPGNPEICDVGDHDEDCDPTTFGVRDADGDDSPDAQCCNVDAAGHATCGDDCDDTRRTVNPDAPEVCNERNDDCDTEVDEEVLVTYYEDADNDHYGSSAPDAPMMMACERPALFWESRDDCDDSNPLVHPGTADLCDAAGIDDDCNGVPNDPPGGCGCTSGAVRACTALGECARGTEVCSAGGMWGACSIGPVMETCDSRDEDCDGEADDGLRVDCYLDADNDGYAAARTGITSLCPVGGRESYGGCPTNYTNRAPIGAAEDCDDTLSTRRPSATETCNTIDDNCNGMVDEGVAITCYGDGDGDGYALRSSLAMSLCPTVPGMCPSGFTSRVPTGMTSSDCEGDMNPLVHPGAGDACGDGLDNDCNGVIDDGVHVNCWNDGDDDGYAPAGAAMGSYCPAPGRVAVGNCPPNTTNRNPTTSADCNDTEDTIHPGATELCDSIDQNCNGSTTDAVRVTCYTDVDNDTYAPLGTASSLQCPDASRTAVGNCPSGYTNRSPASADCNDTNAMIHPGRTEACTVPAVDDNCNGTADEGQFQCWTDRDRDGYARVGATVRGPFCAPMTCMTEETTRDPSIAGNADCDDNRMIVSPVGTEVCDGLDNNCSGVVDEGFYIPRTYYHDLDDDDYGAGALATVSWPSCATSPPRNYSSNNTDCFDYWHGAYPTAVGWAPGIPSCPPERPFPCSNSWSPSSFAWRCDTVPEAQGVPGVFGSCSPRPRCVNPTAPLAPTTIATWDTNCDGSVTPFPSRTNTDCAVGCGTDCTANFGPSTGLCTWGYLGPPMWYYPGAAPACGTMVAQARCTGLCATGCSSGASATMIPLWCR